MLCEMCRRQLAVQSRRVDRGYGEEKLAVCESCSKKVEEEQSMANFSDFFWGFERRITKCPECGLSLDEIKRTKYVGCRECYKVFEDSISGLTSSIHGRNEHVGRMPLSVSNNLDDVQSASTIMQKALEMGSYDLASIARSHFPTKGGPSGARGR